MFSARKIDIDALALGFFIGVVLVSIIWGAAFVQREHSVQASFYTCTYGVVDPESQLLRGVFCREGNVSGDPCPFDLKTTYSGTFYVNEKEIDRVNQFNSKTPDGQRGKWNITITEQ